MPPIKIVEDDIERLFLPENALITTLLPGEKAETLLGQVTVLRDITEFASRDQAKNHFMATLSHELKTPMAALEMTVDLLENPAVGPLNTEQQELVREVRSNLRRIRQTTSDILDLKRIQTGQLEHAGPGP